MAVISTLRELSVLELSLGYPWVLLGRLFAAGGAEMCLSLTPFYKK